MKLHNRLVKAEFWTDTELIRQFSRDQRLFYLGLIQLAEDSGCLENDPWAFKLLLYGLDADLMPEILTEWTQKLVDAGKLLAYSAGGKACLFLTNFAKHQSIKNPQAPMTPLPEWVSWETYETNARSGFYAFDPDKLTVPYARLTPALPNTYTLLPIQSNISKDKLTCSSAPNGAECVPAKKPKHDYAEDFAAFWAEYPKKVGKAEAEKAYQRARGKGVLAEDILTGARHYAASCRLKQTDPQYVCYPKTFVNNERWNDYRSPPSDSMPIWNGRERFGRKPVSEAPPDEEYSAAKHRD